MRRLVLTRVSVLAMLLTSAASAGGSEDVQAFGVERFTPIHDFLVRQKTGLTLEAETDADGFYLVIVHLHDGDLLDTLWVAVGPRATLRLKAQFNPFDSRTPRGTGVDFTDGVPRERPEEFATALERYVRK